MTEKYDVLIIGAGPAGMSAAIQASDLGLSVIVIDDQPMPGGQIWRAVESLSSQKLAKILGQEYSKGAQLVESFRKRKISYKPNTRVWQIEPQWKVYMSTAGDAVCIDAQNIIIACGAQERPSPFQGWTLPGVMPVGAGQILLKTSRQIPNVPVWIAGCGPLVLLYMVQLLRAGGSIAGWLDTSTNESKLSLIPHALKALKGWRDLAKGIRWLFEIKKARIPIIKNVTSIVGHGKNKLEKISYKCCGGQSVVIDASLLLIHEGVVPSIHITKSIGCEHKWNEEQFAFSPVVDKWYETNKSGIFVAGDGLNIGGANVAMLRGQLAAIGVARKIQKITAKSANVMHKNLAKKIKSGLSTRPLLDQLYKPRDEIFCPAPETIVCRCEELTTQNILDAAGKNKATPDQIKSITRAGMGPCQGRQCGHTVAAILSKKSNVSLDVIGFYKIRPPLKQLTFGEFASLNVNESGEAA